MSVGYRVFLKVPPCATLDRQEELKTQSHHTIVGESSAAGTKCQRPIIDLEEVPQHESPGAHTTQILFGTIPTTISTSTISVCT